MNPLLVKTLQFAFHWGGRVAPRSAAFFAYQLFCTPPRLNGRVSRKTNDVFLSAEAFDVSENGQALKVYRWSSCSESKGSQDPFNVLLVHGWGGSARSMQAFVDPLRASGCNVIAFDAPAHGASKGNQTTLLNVAASLREIAGETGPLHAVVGHSFGGMVLAVALGDGDRPANLQTVERLVLIGVPDSMSEILSRYGEHIRLAPPARPHLKARIERKAGRSVNLLSTGSFIAASRVPTLVIHDNQDKEVPVADGEAIAERAPEAQFLPTEGLGHRRILFSSLVADAIVDFVRDGAPKSRRVPGGATRLIV